MVDPDGVPVLCAVPGIELGTVPLMAGGAVVGGPVAGEVVVAETIGFELDEVAAMDLVVLEVGDPLDAPFEPPPHEVNDISPTSTVTDAERV